MIHWHPIVGVISGVLAALAVVPYIKDILHGSTRPNIVSWALWVLLLFIASIAQISAGASWSLVFLIGDLIGTSIIVILCLFGYGYSEYGRVEWTCLTLAVIAIIAWQLTHQPVLAIVFAIAADFMAAFPTVVKAYRDPWSEHPSTWVIICVASALGILSTTVFDLANIAFPAYLLLINGLIGIFALVGRRLKKRSA
jgi:hypothetical protein